MKRQYILRRRLHVSKILSSGDIHIMMYRVTFGGYKKYDSLAGRMSAHSTDSDDLGSGAYLIMYRSDASSANITSEFRSKIVMLPPVLFLHRLN